MSRSRISYRPSPACPIKAKEPRQVWVESKSGASNVDCSPRMVNDMAIGLLDGYECIAVLYGIAFIDLDGGDDAIAVGFDLILHLHGF